MSPPPSRRRQPLPRSRRPIVALDFPDATAALACADQLAGSELLVQGRTRALPRQRRRTRPRTQEAWSLRLPRPQAARHSQHHRFPSLPRGAETGPAHRPRRRRPRHAQAQPRPVPCPSRRACSQSPCSPVSTAALAETGVPAAPWNRLFALPAWLPNAASTAWSARRPKPPPCIAHCPSLIGHSLHPPAAQKAGDQSASPRRNSRSPPAPACWLSGGPSQEQPIRKPPPRPSSATWPKATPANEKSLIRWIRLAVLASSALTASRKNRRPSKRYTLRRERLAHGPSRA